MKRILIYILSAPLFVFLLLVDIIKLPLVIFAIPVFLLLSTIDWLKGQGFDFFPILGDFAFCGIYMYFDIINN